MDKVGQNGVLNYKFSQIFGYKGAHEKIVEDDIITALKFDSIGKYIAIGDKAGRIILFQGDPHSSTHKDYDYLTQFQSHTKEFDPLRSLELEEKIVGIQWLQPQGKYLKMVTANEHRIKLWKLFEKPQKKVIKNSSKDLSLPKLQELDIEFSAEPQTVFPNKHLTPINTVSKSHHQQYLLASDQSRVLLWSFQKPEQPYILADTSARKNGKEGFGEITCSRYHPSTDNLFLYASDKGILEMADLRESSNSETSCISFGTPPLHKNYLYELISSISSVDFIRGGKHVISRDVLTVKLWDICNPKKPLHTFNLNEGMKSKLCEMAENDAIYDKFFVRPSQHNDHILTGSFSNHFHVFNSQPAKNAQYEVSYTKNTQVKEVLKGFPSGKLDFHKKIQVGDWHPKSNTLAVASLNCFFIYSI